MAAADKITVASFERRKPARRLQCAALGGLSELLMPQLLDREFELLDQQGPRPGLRFCGQAGRSLGRAALPSAPPHRRERNHRRPSPTRESQYAGSVRTVCGAIDLNSSDQPAACGRHACCGICQSTSWAGVIVTHHQPASGGRSWRSRPSSLARPRSRPLLTPKRRSWTEGEGRFTAITTMFYKNISEAQP
jgi:hypothetical protein